MVNPNVDSNIAERNFGVPAVKLCKEEIDGA